MMNKSRLSERKLRKPKRKLLNLKNNRKKSKVINRS